MSFAAQGEEQQLLLAFGWLFSGQLLPQQLLQPVRNQVFAGNADAAFGPTLIERL